MPKVMKTNKVYAVKIGRQGPQIYNTWTECEANVARWPGAVHKSFASRAKAEEWLATGTGPIVLRQRDFLSNIGPSLISKSTPIRFPPAQALSYPSPGTSNLIQVEAKSPQASFEEEDFIPLHPERYEAVKNQPEIQLSHEQQLVLKMVRSGRNVFFTGSAGTGKSVLLREIIELYHGQGDLAITASTGIASVNIGGTTLHSWAGIGLGQQSAEKLAGMLLGASSKKDVLARWREVTTLIIDEISMIDGTLFDKLEHIARVLRKSSKPFGGIQLVLSGDFCQLPPVPGMVNGVEVPATFAFEASSWKKCISQPITLTKVFRQKDQAFINMLNAMRFGELDPEAIEVFYKLSRPVVYTDGIEPTELYALRREVDHANHSRLQKIPHDAHTYMSVDIPGYDNHGKRISFPQMERLLDRLIAPKAITLKVDAQVMLIKNLIQGRLVNGSVGKVIGFSTSRDAMKNHTEIAKVDDPREPENLKAKRLQSDLKWPVVRFTNGQTVLCVPAEFTVNNASGDMEARRDQVPLILAWALSVHKSQGQTLERVRVDLGSTFERGQAYVALSRATSMDTLQVLRFSPSKVQAHPRVLAWQEDLERESCLSQEDNQDFDEMDMDEAVYSYYDG